MAFIRTTTPLAQTEIYALLEQTRQHSQSPFSNFQVATIAEIKQDNMYYYIAGVNVELPNHNRLSIHSEQNALASTLTLLGGTTKFNTLWIMAAPKSVTADTAPPAAKSCGHCRQILSSLAMPNAKIYVVTLDGKFSAPNSFEANFLPDNFSERDLHQANTNQTTALPFFKPTKNTIFDLLSETKQLTPDQIASYLQKMSPHIIDNHFQTSRITACILRRAAGGYAAGALMQDIAFLTTDAIFAGLGNAITQFGNTNLYFNAIHLATTSLDPAQLSLTEIDLLSHYTTTNTLIYMHNDKHHHHYTFEECINATTNRLAMRLPTKQVENDTQLKCKL